jgi:hypothetical protein
VGQFFRLVRHEISEVCKRLFSNNFYVFLGYFSQSFVRHHESEVLKAFFRKNLSPTCLKFAKFIPSNYICWLGLVGVRGVWRHQFSGAAKFISSNAGNGVNALISIFYQIIIPSIAIASRWKKEKANKKGVYFNP